MIVFRQYLPYLVPPTTAAGFVKEGLGHRLRPVRVSGDRYYLKYTLLIVYLFYLLLSISVNIHSSSGSTPLILS